MARTARSRPWLVALGGEMVAEGRAELAERADEHPALTALADDGLPVAAGADSVRSLVPGVLHSYATGETPRILSAVAGGPSPSHRGAPTEGTPRPQVGATTSRLGKYERYRVASRVSRVMPATAAWAPM